MSHYETIDSDTEKIRSMQLKEGITNVILTIGVIALYVIWMEILWIFVDSIDGCVGSFFVAFGLIFGFIALVIGVDYALERFMHNWHDIVDTFMGVLIWIVIIYLWRCTLTWRPVFEDFGQMVLYWLLLIGFALGTLLALVVTYDYLEPDFSSCKRKYLEAKPTEDE